MWNDRSHWSDFSVQLSSHFEIGYFHLRGSQQNHGTYFTACLPLLKNLIIELERYATSLSLLTPLSVSQFIQRDITPPALSTGRLRSMTVGQSSENLA